MNDVRQHFPGVLRQTYLNAAAQSLLPTPVMEEMSDSMRAHNELGINAFASYLDGLIRARSAGARLLGARPEQIAFVGNTAAAISQVAGGIDWNDGDEILVGDEEFPAIVLPWLAQQPRGARVRFVPTEEGRLLADRFLEAIGPRTRVVAVSHVQWTSGYCMELEELGRVCAEREILFCVDAIQSLGVLPIDVEKLKIGVLAADGRKWMMGPQGCTLLYVSDDWGRELRPPAVGTMTLANPDGLLDYRDWDRENGVVDMEPHLQAGAARFETGFHNFCGLAGLARAMEFAETVGRERIQTHIAQLTRLAAKTVQERGWTVWGPHQDHERAGITTFSIPGDPTLVYDHLNRNDISISLREGRLRIAPHVYNTEDEVLHCIATIQEALR
ncbi:MAG: aminotransferase class V-fold PLP-dependent enzyme [Acidobacteriota bacterium]|nr:aminotransferase class V-fold PLP-dependent enzyme [Acidobacteriota bacterium]